MTVYANKPAFNVREKLKELEKPSGIAGEAMLRAETPQEQFNLIGAGRRNLLRNALFEISQRGNFQVDASGSAHVASSSSYNVDGWYAYANGGTVNTKTQMVTLPTGEKVRSMKTTSQSAVGSSFLHPAQNFENQTWMENQDFTISAWVRTNRPGQKLRLCDTVSCFTPGNVVPNDEQWHFMVATQRVGTGLGYGGGGFQMQPAFGGGALAVGDYVEFALPQVELGTVATPFDYRPYADELALCHRYFERISKSGSTDQSGSAATETLISNGFAYTGTRSLNFVHFTVVKRVAPTVTINDYTKIEVLDSNAGWVTTSSFGSRANERGTRLDLTHPGNVLTPGRALEVRMLDGGLIDIDAELT